MSQENQDKIHSIGFQKFVLKLSDSASGDVFPPHEVREVQKKLILANSDEDIYTLWKFVFRQIFLLCSYIYVL